MLRNIITPIKIVRSSVDDFGRVCNTSLIIYGYGKLNLFYAENAKKLNVVARLSSVLGFPVCKQDDASSRLCMKCRRELEKLENLNGALEIFRNQAHQTFQMQRELVENSMQTRTKSCHGNSPQSPIAKKAAPKSPFRPAGRRQILTPVTTQNVARSKLLEQVERLRIYHNSLVKQPTHPSVLGKPTTLLLALVLMQQYQKMWTTELPEQHFQMHKRIHDRQKQPPY